MRSLELALIQYDQCPCKKELCSQNTGRAPVKTDTKGRCSCENGDRLELCYHNPRDTWGFQTLGETRMCPFPKALEGVFLLIVAFPTSSTMPGYITTFCNNDLQIEKVTFTITWEAFTKNSCSSTKLTLPPRGFIPIALKHLKGFPSFYSRYSSQDHLSHSGRLPYFPELSE